MGLSEYCDCEHIDLGFLKERMINGRIGEEVSEDLIFSYAYWQTAAGLQLNPKTLMFT